MPTPYEEISDLRSSSGNVRTDANLALDSLMLGGIAAEEYATKVYVNRVRDYIIDLCKDYADEEIAKALAAAKAYTDTVVRNIDYSRFATKADLSAAIDAAVEQCHTYINNAISQAGFETKAEHNADMQNMNDYINQIYQELFQSVSNGKRKIADAITDKNVPTSASATFDTMAENIRKINVGEGTGEGYINTYDATATPDKILSGYTAYASGEKITGTYQPSSIDISGGGSGTAEVGNLIYGQSPSEAQSTLSGYDNIVTGDNGMNIVYQNNTIYVGNLSSTEKVVDGSGEHTVKTAYTFNELGIPSGYSFNSMKLSPLDKNHFKLAIAVISGGSAYVYVFKVYTEPREFEGEYKYIPIENMENDYGNGYKDVMVNNWKITVSNFGIITQYFNDIKVEWSTTDSNMLIIGATGSGSGGYGYSGMMIAKLNENIELENIDKASTEAVSSRNLRTFERNFGFAVFKSAQLVGKLLLYSYDTTGLMGAVRYYSGIIVLSNSVSSAPTMLNDLSIYSEVTESKVINGIALTNDSQYLIDYTGNIKLLNVNYEQGTIRLVDEGKTLGITDIEYSRTNSTDEYLLIKKSGNTYLYQIDLTSNTAIVNQEYEANTTDSNFTEGRKAVIVKISSNRYIIKFENDYNKLLGIEYDGNTFVLIEAGLYTAKPENVTSGKTFLGYAGSPEVGTLGGGTSE